MEMKIVGGILCLMACILIGAIMFAAFAGAVTTDKAVTGGLFAVTLMAGGFLYLGDSHQ